MSIPGSLIESVVIKRPHSVFRPAIYPFVQLCSVLDEKTKRWTKKPLPNSAVATAELDRLRTLKDPLLAEEPSGARVARRESLRTEQPLQRPVMNGWHKLGTFIFQFYRKADILLLEGS